MKRLITFKKFQSSSINELYSALGNKQKVDFLVSAIAASSLLETSLLIKELRVQRLGSANDHLGKAKY